MRDKDADNTKRATKTAVGLFRAYLVAKGQSSDFEKLDKASLAASLSKFYFEARKEDGDFYKTTSLCSIRAGINRHLKDKYPEMIDIIKDCEFTNANVSYRAATVQLKKMGKGDIVHHPPLDENNIDKLYNSGGFHQNNPTGLLHKVWFEIMIYICRRGRENLKELKRDHFTVQTDSDGCQYVAQAVDEMTKKKLGKTIGPRDKMLVECTKQVPRAALLHHLRNMCPSYLLNVTRSSKHPKQSPLNLGLGTKKLLLEGIRLATSCLCYPKRQIYQNCIQTIAYEQHVYQS